jgi:Mrp family chromosome partitioning ATPase
MSSMLQALKNLEARSAWPLPKKHVLGHLAAGGETGVALSNPIQAAESASEVLAAQPQPLFAVDRVANATVAPVAIPPTAVSPVFSRPFDKPAASTPAVRAPSSAERESRRALSEPHRRQPIRDLADRLRQDAHETGSRTLLFVGIGDQSATHSALLHTAAILAEEGGRVLLIDGDLAQRSLTLELEAVQQAGLSNLISANVSTASDLILATAFQRLAFLPAGTQRPAVLPTAGDRLTRVLGELTGSYDLLLIDGGRSNDAAAHVLARLADATYVVVQLGTVEASAAQAALRDLRSGGARVLGCVATS